MSRDVLLAPLNYVAVKIQAHPKAWRRGAMWFFLGSWIVFTILLMITPSQPKGGELVLVVFLLASVGYIATSFFVLVGVVFFRFLYRVPQTPDDSLLVVLASARVLITFIVYSIVFVAVPAIVSTLVLLCGVAMLFIRK